MSQPSDTQKYAIIDNGLDLAKRLQAALEKNYPRISWVVNYPTSWPPDQSLYVYASFTFDKNRFAYKHPVDLYHAHRLLGHGQDDEFLRQIALNVMAEFCDFLLGSG